MKPHLLVCALLLSLLAQTESESTTAESGTSTVTGATTESVSDPTTIATEPSTIATESTIKATEPSTIATESTIKATESTVNATESTVNATESTVNATRDPSNVTEPSYNVTTPAETNVTGGGAGSTAKPELTGTTTAPPAPDKKTCSATSCGKSFATCIQLFNSFVCQCPLNYYFNETALICIQGDAFYGNLELSAEDFNPKKDSPGYTAVYNQVLTHFRDCFKNNTNYSDTIITDISAPKPKVQSRSRNSVPVSVRCFHVFVPKAVTEKEVLEAINTYNNGTNLLGTYSSKSVCDGFYCDAETTTCTQTDSNPVCTCKAEFYPSSSSQPTYTSCRGCDPICGNFPGEQCIQGPSGLPECRCLAGYKKTASGSCEKCQFGYSGEGCTDNFLLILVIVGSVAGAAVIALLGAVIGLSVKSSRRNSDNERTQLITKENTDSPVTGSLFPKVQARTDLGFVNRGSNSYEITEEFPRPTPKPDYDDDPWYEMSNRERRY